MSTTPPLRLDGAACDGCGVCVPLCKPKALRVGPGYVSVDWEKCSGCGKCAEACPSGAIALRSASVTRGPAATPSDKATKPPKAARARVSADTGARAVPSAWAWPEAFLAMLCAFALYIGMQAVPSAFAHAPVLSGLTLLAYDAALAALLVFLARRRGLSVLKAFRLDVAPEWSSLGLAIALAVGCWLASVGYRAASQLAGIAAPASEGPDMAVLFGPGAVGAVLTVLVVAVVGPAIEEALLRGVVAGALRDRFGPVPAVAASAIGFALLHASVWSFVPLTVLGVALGWLAVRSRSLWPAVIAHVLYNAVFVGAALYKALGG